MKAPDYPITNSTLRRHTPLGPGSGVTRHTPMKRRGTLKSRRVSKRFASKRDPDYCAWIRTQCCAVIWNSFDGPMPCAGRAECAHVVSRGAGGMDVGNTLCLCTRHHRESHLIGQKTFEAKHDVDLARIAKILARRYKGIPMSEVRSAFPEKDQP